MNDYPEHDRLKESDEERQVIGGFLEWMQDQGMVIAHWRELPDGVFNDEALIPDGISIEDRLALYFEIDRDRIEAEKRAMLSELRQASSGDTLGDGGERVPVVVTSRRQT